MIKKLKYQLNLINEIEKKHQKKNVPKITIGDNVKIKKIIQEGNKERIQISEGVVISKNNSQINTTVTVRKVIQNVGVEKIYLLHSPQILNIEITKQSKIRRAKLYYLRNRSGKATRLKQKLS
uniref:Large ribosomal subunit protein bL19c n=1 Tax=Periphykon beckeri TaxID=2006982 RepID=A0A1Z1M3I4_9FLOR|nr:ribosomal protein L19 [Periphykon beckeri]ARW60482.1 ribosomal protein L19 [Periphykon beckeri]